MHENPSEKKTNVLTRIQFFPPLATTSTLTDVVDCLTRERLLGLPSTTSNTLLTAVTGFLAEPASIFQTAMRYRALVEGGAAADSGSLRYY
jgi:hypothetical protein